MAPARKLSATDTTGCSWCSTTASCNPLGRVVSLNGGKRTGGSGVGFGGRDGNESWAVRADRRTKPTRSEEHTSELQSPDHLVCRLLLEKKKQNNHLHVYYDPRFYIRLR